MALLITETDASAFPDYGDISIAFSVRSVMHASPTPSGGFALTEEPLQEQFSKDYDAIDGNHPRDWLRQWPQANWRLFAAVNGGTAVGRAAVVWRTPGIDMLENREDLMVLWDIRVAKEARRLGTGTALMSAVEGFAQQQSCRELKVETQTINVPACRFYQKCGFTLRQVNEEAYPGLPGETQLLWYKRLE